MVTLGEAKQHLQTQKELLIQRRKEALTAEESLEKIKTRIPQVTQQRLRDAKGIFSGLKGRERRRMAERAKQELSEKYGQIKGFKEGLSEYELQQLIPLEKEIATVEKQQSAYNVLRSEAEKTLQEYEGQFTS